MRLKKKRKRKRIGGEIFKVIKNIGVENENGNLICTLEKLKEKVNVGDEEFEKALEYCKTKKCIRTYQGKIKVVVILMKEEFPEEVIPGIDELKAEVIKVVKTSNEETEEGFMFMSEENILKQMTISRSKLNEVVKYGLKEELLKFEVIKEVKIIVYTHERRLSISKLV